MKTTREIREIAREIRNDWKNVYFGAAPYIDAMSTIGGIDENFGYDSARSIINYFLVNSSSWRGDTARRVKLELKSMLK